MDVRKGGIRWRKLLASGWSARVEIPGYAGPEILDSYQKMVDCTHDHPDEAENLRYLLEKVGVTYDGELVCLSYMGHVPGSTAIIVKIRVNVVTMLRRRNDELIKKMLERE